MDGAPLVVWRGGAGVRGARLRGEPGAEGTTHRAAVAQLPWAASAPGSGGCAAVALFSTLGGREGGGEAQKEVLGCRTVVFLLSIAPDLGLGPR